MAALMITGSKVGDLLGRRAFAIGLVVYSVGSALTAIAWSVPALGLGWSVLEGIGAALVLPALVALIAGNYEGRDRVVAYALIGGVAGIGIAVGPILGAPHLDWVGSALSAVGLGLVVIAILQASTWGWLMPKDSPVDVLGFALTPFVVAAGLCVLWLFVAWQRRRERRGEDPLVRLELFDVAPLRGGLQTFLAQNLILMGTFFSIPLYLQLVVGLNALETGVRMLPISIAMFVTSLSGSGLATRFSPRTIVRAGFVVLVVSLLLLMGAIEPELQSTSFALAMAMLGIGMGLVASQLGNVVQSAVGPDERSEAGGLQWTSQQLGSSLGVALIGAIVLSGLTATFTNQITADARISDEVAQEVSVPVSGGVDFVPTDAVAERAADAGLDDDTAEALVESYAAAQLLALKAGLLAALGLAAGALAFTRHLPSARPRPDPRTDRGVVAPVGDGVGAHVADGSPGQAPESDVRDPGTPSRRRSSARAPVRDDPGSRLDP